MTISQASRTLYSLNRKSKLLKNRIEELSPDDNSPEAIELKTEYSIVLTKLNSLLGSVTNRL